MDNVGQFLPTTYEFDIGELTDMEVNSYEFKELIIRLYQNINSIILSVNNKETGYYSLTQFVTGKLWYPNPALNSTTPQTPILRQAYRIVVPFGPLTNNSTKSVPHGLIVTPTFRMKIIDCVANRPIVYSAVPIPYASTLQPVPENIEIYIDATNINISTISVVTDWTQYTDVDVILEYIL